MPSGALLEGRAADVHDARHLFQGKRLAKSPSKLQH